MSLRSDAKTVEQYFQSREHVAGEAAALRLARPFAMERPVAVKLTRESQILWTPDWGDTVLRVSVIKGGPHGRYYATEADALTAMQCDLADKFARDWQAAEDRKLELGHGGGN